MFLVGTHLEFIFLTLLENSFQVNSFFSHFFIFRQTCSCLYLLCVSNSHLAVKKNTGQASTKFMAFNETSLTAQSINVH